MLTVTETVTRFDVSRATLQRLIAADQIPATRHNRAWLLPVTEVEARWTPRADQPPDLRAELAQLRADNNRLRTGHARAERLEQRYNDLLDAHRALQAELTAARNELRALRAERKREHNNAGRRGRG
jgi:hypothetical protein